MTFSPTAGWLGIGGEARTQSTHHDTESSIDDIHHSKKFRNSVESRTLLSYSEKFVTGIYSESDECRS
jgi:hypothetical protein